MIQDIFEQHIDNYIYDTAANANPIVQLQKQHRKLIKQVYEKKLQEQALAESSKVIAKSLEKHLDKILN